MYEQAFERWERKRQFKQSVGTFVRKVQKSFTKLARLSPSVCQNRCEWAGSRALSQPQANF
jgi:hypothetical protein